MATAWEITARSRVPQLSLHHEARQTANDMPCGSCITAISSPSGNLVGGISTSAPSDSPLLTHVREPGAYPVDQNFCLDSGLLSF